MRSFKSKNDEVLNHWIGFVDNFTYPSGDFYDAVEGELVERKIPGLEVSRVEYAEGGLLSHQRVYLRMIRERLAIDTCAAPFGTGYFFSCRTVYDPVLLRWWHILVAWFILNGVFVLLVKPLGIDFAALATLALVLAISLILRNAVAFNLADLDTALLKIPALGPIYERWFRKDTYYRQDTRLVYLETVPTLIKELAEELTAAKGVKLSTQYKHGPVLGELYKPVKPGKESGSGHAVGP